MISLRSHEELLASDVTKKPNRMSEIDDMTQPGWSKYYAVGMV
jgi:hypothetical protein